MAQVSGTARGSVNTLRRIVKEMRQTLPKDKPVRSQPLTKYILNEYRRHQVTTKQHCKAGQDMEHLSNTYDFADSDLATPQNDFIWIGGKKKRV